MYLYIKKNLIQVRASSLSSYHLFFLGFTFNIVFQSQKIKYVLPTHLYLLPIFITHSKYVNIETLSNDMLQMEVFPFNFVLLQVIHLF